MLSLGTVLPVWGQNLLKNGDFEEVSPLPDAISQIHRAKEWHPVSVTADLFCYPEFYNILPHSGSCYAGFGLWISNPPFITTESFRQRLEKPLEPGKQYYLKFHAARANFLGGTCSEIQIYGLSEDPGSLNAEDNYLGTLPIAEWLGSSEKIYTEDFQLVEICFVPNQLSWHLAVSVKKGGCDQYFYIDDLELYELEEGKFFEAETSLCLGDTILLGTEIPNATFQWQDGSTEPIYTVTEPGLYWLAVDTVCNLQISDTIIVHDGRIYLEEDFLGKDTTLCEGDILSIMVPSVDPELSFFWNTGDTTSNIAVQEDGIYQAFVKKKDCLVWDELRADFNFCADCQLYVPNVFSPNGDGINDYLQVFSNCMMNRFALYIFDRWGNLVFESSSIDDSWNGKINGNQKAESGIYVYLIKYEAEQYGELKSDQITGDAMLIR